MDTERAPEPIRDFIAAIVCPVCQTKKADGVLVKVMFQQPSAYTLVAHCLRCGQTYGWTFSGPPPTPASVVQARDVSSNAVPLPQWVRDLSA